MILLSKKLMEFDKALSDILEVKKPWFIREIGEGVEAIMVV